MSSTTPTTSTANPSRALARYLCSTNIISTSTPTDLKALMYSPAWTRETLKHWLLYERLPGELVTEEKWKKLVYLLVEEGMEKREEEQKKAQEKWEEEQREEEAGDGFESVEVHGGRRDN